MSTHKICTRCLHSAARSLAPPSKGARFPGRNFGGRTAAGDSSGSTSAARTSSGPSWASQSVDVSHLPSLSLDVAQEDNIGKAYRYPESYNSDILQQYARPSTLADLAYHTPPTTTLRSATRKLLDMVKDGANDRIVLIGRPGSGRTTILHQAMACANPADHLIIYIPDVNDHVKGKYSLTKSQEGVYEQPDLAQSILQQILKSNSRSLQKCSPELRSSLQAGAKDASLAASGLRGLLASKTSQSPHILLVIDGAESLFRPSRYLDENVQTIPVNKLGVPGLLFDYATGSKKLAKGSVIMAADGTADLLRLPGETGRLCVDKLTKTEAAGLFANLAETQMLNTGLTDASFMDRYVASDGNALQFSRGLRDIVAGTARGVVRRKAGHGRGIPQRDDRFITIST